MGLVLTAWLLQAAPGCGAEAAAVSGRALNQATNLDDAAATASYLDAAARGCPDAVVAAVYLQGLQAARAAYPLGGSPDSLEPVRRAVSVLEVRADAGDAAADIARVLLLAAAAAAESERDDMTTFLEHAARLEDRLRAQGSGVRLPVTAREAAGDLWLQVHRFDSALTAYRQAAAILGMTPRIAIGMARTAMRLGDAAAACASYRTAVATLTTARPGATELVEATSFVDERCRP